MSMEMKQQGYGETELNGFMGKKVMVVVKASKEISRTALVWTLTHVVQPGDSVKLLVVFPAFSSSKRTWGLSRFTNDCTPGHVRSLPANCSDHEDDVVDSYSQMMHQLQDVYDPQKIKVRLKTVLTSPSGVVAAEAKKAESNWVILDKQLKHEKKCCIRELQCNLVVMKNSRPKVLRLNLVGSSQKMEPLLCPESFEFTATLKHSKTKNAQSKIIKARHLVTPASSPDQGSSSTPSTVVGTPSISCSDHPATSPFVKGFAFYAKSLSFLRKQYNPNTNSSEEFTKSTPSKDTPRKKSGSALTSTSDKLLDKLSSLNQQPDSKSRNHDLDHYSSKNVRKAVSLTRNAPSGPPPLCSICQHKAPKFGNPPRWFTYTELDLATRGFSQANFLAEGGFGSVHRGILPDGLKIAVKQYKLASSQGDREFCSEVEVLSCAQHRNVVMLIGLCVEDGRRLLVYEYICNGSLDSHLYGPGREPLGWPARQKIAVGAARGLRYLHEECRVGCIVHRDMRPNNILLTHDFEPLVGDFGLARWQPDGDKGVETRVIGTFGYLAPEYTQSGQITEKADVYSFGVVLLELITGRKAMDMKRPRGQLCLTEWARPLLQRHAIDELLDPGLRNFHSEQEVYGMAKCASLCLRRDPNTRPRMSQMLRMLEGEIVMNSTKQVNS